MMQWMTDPATGQAVMATIQDLLTTLHEIRDAAKLQNSLTASLLRSQGVENTWVVSVLGSPLGLPKDTPLPSPTADEVAKLDTME